MATSNITMKQAEEKLLNDATPETVQRLLKQLASKDKKSKLLINQYNASQFDELLEQNHINDYCPHCGEMVNISKNGKYKNGLQRFHCKSCGKNYNRLTNTFLSNTSFSADYWIDLIWHETNELSLKKELQNLIDGSFLSTNNEQTVWLHRMKLMQATHELQPSLSGIVEIDECHIREAQKGEHELINYFEHKGMTRKARYSYKPSKYGVKGSEFITIVCAIDNQKNHFTYVSGFGALKKADFNTYVVPHIANATWLCSDANVIYTEYSQHIGLPHYVKPSDYAKNYKECKTDDEKADYYKQGKLDYILNVDNRMTYREMLQKRDELKLGISNINEFHKDIKLNIEDTKNAVNLEYAQLYLDWMTYLKNVANALCTYPTTRAHAKWILIDLLNKSSAYVTLKELRQRNGQSLPKPSRQFIANLVKKTDEIRSGSSEEKFAFTNEDIGTSFSVKNQLSALPVYILKEMGKNLKIKGYTKAKPNHTWALVKALEKHADINNELIRIRQLYPKQFNDIHNVR